MKATKTGLTVCLSILFTCLLQAQPTSTPLAITLKTNHAREIQTKEQILRLAKDYNLSKWFFTKNIVIENGFNVVPHSHPVLTLNTRHLKDDELLLGTFIHEQCHWYLDTLGAKQAIYDEIKALFPNPSSTFPEGSGDSTSTWYHIMVCYLEYKGLVELLGELKAFEVISFWQQDHYTWIYKTVWENRQKLGTIVRKYKMVL